MHENHLILAGYLGTKPELRYLPSGTPVANARLAQSYPYLKNGKQEEHTNWFSLVFYGDLADIATKFEKGQNIYVTGRLEQRQWEAKTGSKRNIYEVVVHRCHRIASFAASDKPLGPTSANASDELTDENADHESNDEEWVI
jgi:single-strand DNA-binding protein